MKEEQYIQTAICNYIRANYPDVIFTSDLNGVKLPIGVATRLKTLKSGRGIPDLLVLHPKGKYHSLAIEIKTEYARLYKKDGSGFLANDHVSEQAAVLQQLRDVGFAAFFSCGVSSTKNLIDWYLSEANPFPYYFEDSHQSLLWIG